MIRGKAYQSSNLGKITIFLLTFIIEDVKCKSPEQFTMESKALRHLQHPQQFLRLPRRNRHAPRLRVQNDSNLNVAMFEKQFVNKEDAEERYLGKCFTATFETSTEVTYAESKGRFAIDGYSDGNSGDIPSYCKDKRGASCTLTVCPPTNYLTVRAYTTDAWLFRVYQSCPLKTILPEVETYMKLQPGHENYPQTATWMDVGQFDTMQEYSYAFPQNECHTLRFRTFRMHKDAGSEGNFSVRNSHGEIIANIDGHCTKRGSVCDIRLCHNEDTFKIYAHTRDGWNFDVCEVDNRNNNANALPLVGKTTSVGGEHHHGYVWMDTDQFAHERSFIFKC